MKGLVITTENKMQVREFDEPAYAMSTNRSSP